VRRGRECVDRGCRKRNEAEAAMTNGTENLHPLKRRKRMKTECGEENAFE